MDRNGNNSKGGEVSLTNRQTVQSTSPAKERRDNDASTMTATTKAIETMLPTEQSYRNIETRASSCRPTNIRNTNSMTMTTYLNNCNCVKTHPTASPKTDGHAVPVVPTRVTDKGIASDVNNNNILHLVRKGAATDPTPKQPASEVQDDSFYNVLSAATTPRTSVDGRSSLTPKVTVPAPKMVAAKNTGPKMPKSGFKQTTAELVNAFSDMYNPDKSAALLQKVRKQTTREFRSNVANGVVGNPGDHQQIMRVSNRSDRISFQSQNGKPVGLDNKPSTTERHMSWDTGMYTLGPPSSSHHGPFRALSGARSASRTHSYAPSLTRSVSRTHSETRQRSSRRLLSPPPSNMKVKITSVVDLHSDEDGDGSEGMGPLDLDTFNAVLRPVVAEPEGEERRSSLRELSTFRANLASLKKLGKTEETPYVDRLSGGGNHTKLAYAKDRHSAFLTQRIPVYRASPAAMTRPKPPNPVPEELTHEQPKSKLASSWWESDEKVRADGYRASTCRFHPWAPFNNAKVQATCCYFFRHATGPQPSYRKLGPPDRLLVEANRARAELAKNDSKIRLKKIRQRGAGGRRSGSTDSDATTESTDPLSSVPPTYMGLPKIIMAQSSPNTKPNNTSRFAARGKPPVPLGGSSRSLLKLRK